MPQQIPTPPPSEDESAECLPAGNVNASAIPILSSTQKDYTNAQDDAALVTSGPIKMNSFTPPPTPSPSPSSVMAIYRDKKAGRKREPLSVSPLASAVTLLSSHAARTSTSSNTPFSESIAGPPVPPGLGLGVTSQSRVRERLHFERNRRMRIDHGKWEERRERATRRAKEQLRRGRKKVAAMNKGGGKWIESHLYDDASSGSGSDSDTLYSQDSLECLSSSSTPDPSEEWPIPWNAGGPGMQSMANSARRVWDSVSGLEKGDEDERASITSSSTTYSSSAASQNPGVGWHYERPSPSTASLQGSKGSAAGPDTSPTMRQLAEDTRSPASSRIRSSPSNRSTASRPNGFFNAQWGDPIAIWLAGVAKADRKMSGKQEQAVTGGGQHVGRFSNRRRNDTMNARAQAHAAQATHLLPGL